MNRIGSKAELAEFDDDEHELARGLLSLRQPPRPTLQARVRAITASEPSRRVIIPRLAWVALALALAVLLFGSASARATLNEIEKVIGQVPLLIREGWSSREATATVTLESRLVSLATARASLPFKIYEPGYLPDGFAAVNEGQVAILDLETPVVKMEWRKPRDGVLLLSQIPYGADAIPIETLVGPDSSDPILVNGREAVMVKGGWGQASGAWERETRVLTLIWRLDGVQYRLLAAETDLPLEELIAVAESIR